MNNPDEPLVEENAGHCWRCVAPFALGDTITVVRARFLYRSSYDGQIRRDVEAEMGVHSARPAPPPMNARAPPSVLSAKAALQPLATPSVQHQGL